MMLFQGCVRFGNRTAVRCFFLEKSRCGAVRLTVLRKKVTRQCGFPMENVTVRGGRYFGGGKENVFVLVIKPVRARQTPGSCIRLYYCGTLVWHLLWVEAPVSLYNRHTDVLRGTWVYFKKWGGIAEVIL